MIDRVPQAFPLWAVCPTSDSPSVVVGWNAAVSHWRPVIACPGHPCAMAVGGEWRMYPTYEEADLAILRFQTT